MTRTAPSTAKLSTRFDAFLYANVGADGSGTSVVSMLARADLDPWHVAQQLAAMSRPLATLHLARLIASHSGGPASYAQPDLRTCVDRLPSHPLAKARSGARPAVSLAAIFIAVNALFFILLCISLMRPLPERNVGSPRVVSEEFVVPGSPAHDPR